VGGVTTAVQAGLIGVPTSAGAFAPGQELAPAALRAAGLVEQLRARRLDLADHGDRSPWRWRPDPVNPRAQNLPAVREIAVETARRVRDARRAGQRALVLGGDCTIELGTVLGCRDDGGSTGLLYFDLHPDLNVPENSIPGALDWMGSAHMLAVHGAAEELVRIGGDSPLLADDQILFFAYGPGQATDWERELIERRELSAVAVERVASDPEGAAHAALRDFASRFDRLLVHFDVDTIDFTDAPLSENTGRNQGLSFDQALSALGVLAASDRLAALTVTELNPLHGAEDGSTVARFADALADCLAAWAA
jgi:arginase